MRAVKNQWFPLLLCTVFLLGPQLSLALNPSSEFHLKSDVSASKKISPLQNERVLDTVTTNCNTMPCSASDSIQDQNSALVFVTNFDSLTTIEIQIQVGKPAYTLQMTLSSSPLVPMETSFDLDSSQDVSVSHLDGANWQSSLSFASSDDSSRQLTITIANNSPYQGTTSTLTITVDDASSSTSWGSVIGGAIGGVIMVIIILMCIRRRRRLRRLMRRRHAQASYQAQNIQQFPQQQHPGQPGQFQAQLQGSIIYQPINPNSPHYQMQMQMQQPGNIQYVPVMADPNLQFQQNIQYIPVADPNYQQQPIQYVPVANYPQPDYQGQGQGIQLAPPIQMVMPANPEEGPLSEMNFNHRFPEAPFQNFASSFPQKTCSICLEDLKIDQNCRQLYCEHIFHGECARDWLLNQMVKQNHGYCPNCNKNMTFVMERAKPSNGDDILTKVL